VRIGVDDPLGTPMTDFGTRSVKGQAIALFVLRPGRGDSRNRSLRPGEDRSRAERDSRVAKDAVAVLRSDTEDKAVCVVEYPSGNGDELAAQPLAVYRSWRPASRPQRSWTPVEMLSGGTPTTSRCGSPPQSPTGGGKSCSELPSVIFSSTRARIVNHASISVTSQSRLVQMKL